MTLTDSIRGLFFVAAVAISANAEEVRVSGRVTDKTNTPISGARIVVKPVGGDQVLQTESDRTGAFGLLLPAAGEYAISVDRTSYYLYKAASLRIDSSPFELHVLLESVHELRTSVEVTASPGTFDMERTAPQNTLSSRTLFDVPFANQNSLRSGLRMLPGLVQDSRGGIHIYGAAEEQTHHNFEGFQLNDPLTGRLDARMSLEAVESVEAAPGQPGAEFGRGVGGTLSVHARKGDDKYRYSATNLFPGIDTQRGTTLGSWTPRGNISGPWWKGKAWFFNTTELQYINTLVPDLPGGQNRSRSYRANDLLHNQFNLSPSNVLTVGLLFNYWFAPRNGLSALDPRETTVDRRSRQWFGYVKEQKSFQRGALVEVGYAVSRTFNREVPQGDSLYIVTDNGRRGNYYANSEREAKREQAIVNAYLPVFLWRGSHQFKVGGDLLWLGYNQTIQRTGILFEGIDSTPLRSVLFYGSGSLSLSNRESSVYVQDSWRMRSNLLVELGVRSERNRILQKWNLSPRLGFAFSPSGREDMRITGGVARVFDNTNLRTFTRPEDQYAVSRSYGLGGLPSDPALSIYRIFSARLTSPNSLNWNLGIERMLRGRMIVQAQWLLRRGSSGFSYINSLPAPQHVPGLLEFQGSSAPLFDAIYGLTNRRRDSYHSVDFSVRQPLGADHEWMASYMRSSARSNAVVDRHVDEPSIVGNNSGPLPWDAPNRLLSWGFLPTPFKNWSIAYLLENRSGFPFSVQDQTGRVQGSVDDHRFPSFFELNLFAERRMTIRGYRIGLRGGLINITGHRNPNVVNNVIGSPLFLQMHGGQRRALNFRVRFLGKV
ncbi:MAG: TonB-dependent receptor [Acidobacteria bacterium]|nr:TonB-dependent receptor [Acidobacteriota bacterium]